MELFGRRYLEHGSIYYVSVKLTKYVPVLNRGGVEEPGGVAVAVKVIRDIVGSGNELCAKQALREIKSLRLLNHRNIVKLRHIFWSNSEEL